MDGEGGGYEEREFRRVFSNKSTILRMLVAEIKKK
jgi:hypothetical protein